MSQNFDSHGQNRFSYVGSQQYDPYSFGQQPSSSNPELQKKQSYYSEPFVASQVPTTHTDEHAPMYKDDDFTDLDSDFNSRSLGYSAADDLYEGPTKSKNKSHKWRWFCCCLCLILLIVVIIIVVVATTFSIPGLNVIGITPGNPQYVVTKNTSLSKRQLSSLFSNIVTSNQRVDATNIPQGTDIIVNMIANIAIDNKNWFSLPVQNQQIGMFVAADPNIQIGSGTLPSNVGANQQSSQSIPFQMHYLQNGTPPTWINYLFEKCDGTGQNIDLIFRVKVLVKSVDIPKQWRVH